MILRAPAKLNLCLYVGPRQEDGLHEIRSLFQSLTLADRLVVTDAEADEVRCPGVEGPNLATAALKALRARGWERPPLRVDIEKRTPVAAGLGGGSADAAALLRLAREEVEGVEQVAMGLGADVPSQLDPGLALVADAGALIEPLPPPGEYALVLVPAGPAEGGLSTADVYAEADRLGLGRDRAELDRIYGRLRDAARSGASPLEYADLLVNDLQRAALELRPEIAGALEALEAAGAGRALITGSGPTAFGLFGDIALADRAAASLPHRYAHAVVAAPESYR